MTTLQVSCSQRSNELLYLAQSENVIKMALRLDVGEALFEPESLAIAK